MDVRKCLFDKMAEQVCIVCRTRPAVLPDRYRSSRRKKVCRECHADRLRDDLKRVLKAALGEGRGEGEGSE